MGRHKKIEVDLPAWVSSSSDTCLRSVAEDAYYARALARTEGAHEKSSCRTTMAAGEKSLAIMADSKQPSGRRCAEGDRAARKFWEAKVCARNQLRKRA